MKRDYDTYMGIKNNSGFGWDEVHQVPTAPEGVWETYMKEHPEAEKFRKRVTIPILDSSAQQVTLN